MLTVLTHLKVQAYAKWRPVFDDLNPLRQAHSLVSERVFRDAVDPNQVFVEMRFRDAARARAYMTSPALHNGMEKAGVIPPPEIHYLEDAPAVVANDGLPEIVRALTLAIQAHDWDGACGMLARDFKFSGATPIPLSGEQWIGIHRALGAAMPDLDFNYAPSEWNSLHTRGTVKLTGTHRGEFNLPTPGFPRVPPTGNAIANPTEYIEVTVENGQVTVWHVEPVPNGGLPGILAQMGAALP